MMIGLGLSLATPRPAGGFGPELYTGGDFASATGFTLSATASISGGVLTMTANSALVTATRAAAVAASVGASYRLTYTVVSNTLNAGNLRVGGLSGASFFGAVKNLTMTPGTYTLDFTGAPSGAGTTLDLYVTATATSGAIVLDDFSLVQIL